MSLRYLRHLDSIMSVDPEKLRVSLKVVGMGHQMLKEPRKSIPIHVEDDIGVEEAVVTTTDQSEDGEKKQAKKRGRPRKNPVEPEPEPEAPSQETSQPKKRGRKKKQEAVIDSTTAANLMSQLTAPTPVVTKSYIVQLKVKSADLDKIQKQFLQKSQQVGYRPLQSVEPNANVMGSENLSELGSSVATAKSCNYEEYYKLLNNLEMPLNPVMDSQNHLTQRMTSSTVFGSTFREQLPEVPNVYSSIVLPVLPGNVPIHLFDQNIETITQSGSSMSNKYGGGQLAFRNTI